MSFIRINTAIITNYLLCEYIIIILSITLLVIHLFIDWKARWCESLSNTSTHFIVTHTWNETPPSGFISQ